MHRAPENDEVYCWLVAELANSIVPTTIMGLTIFGIGLFAYSVLGTPEVAIACSLGSLASLAKVVLLVRQGRRQAHGTLSKAEAIWWERGHIFLSAGVAASVGGFAYAVFSRDDLHMQMLAIGLTFGYGSGIVSRVSVRPTIAIPALIMAVLPTIACAAFYGDVAQRIIALVFFVFLLGGFESVFHHHRNAVRQITMRLDMARLARNDPLTGLRNRLGLREAFRELSRGGTGLIAVHCFDLDGFKLVNDRHGHSAGDALLRMLAERLNHAMPRGSVAARIGGDEFVVLQSSFGHADDAERLARHILQDLTAPYELPDGFVSVGLSLGYSMAATDNADLECLLAQADGASYITKRVGGGIARHQTAQSAGSGSRPDVVSGVSTSRTPSATTLG